MRIAPPAADEFAPYYGTYVKRVPGDDAFAPLVAHRSSTAALLASVTPAQAAHRYADGKWTVREVIGHLSDAERIFAYRLLRFARNDATPLSGFDENHYVPAGEFERRSLAAVAAEFAAVRDSTIALLRGLSAEALLRRGPANGKEVSVRSLAWIIAGHEAHHIRVLGERYIG